MSSDESCGSCDENFQISIDPLLSNKRAFAIQQMKVFIVKGSKNENLIVSPP
jgi:hypothetical protein